MIYQSSVLEELLLEIFVLFLSKRINEFILMRNSTVNSKQWYIPCINWNKQIIRNLKYYCLFRIKQLTHESDFQLLTFACSFSLPSLL